MADHTELKRLAEAAYGAKFQTEGFEQTDGRGQHYGGLILHENGHTIIASCVMQPWADFIAAADPFAVLTLIAENGRIKARLCVCRDCGGQGEVYAGHSSYQGHNQPPEPDMDVCGTCGGDGVLGPLEDFESLAAERDQLKAELAGLRTGYEAYESVNKGLKAEMERLRSVRETMLCAAHELGLPVDAGAQDVVDAIHSMQVRCAELSKALRGLLNLYDTDEGCRSLPQYIAGRAAIGKGEQS